MKILVTGSNGLLGQHLIHALVNSGHTVTGISKGPNRIDGNLQGFTYKDVDITRAIPLRDTVDKEKPDIVVHAAAMTQVDKCEEEKQTCYNTNVSATRFLVDALKAHKSRLIYVSTDFVFDGLKGPYTEEDQPAPVNYYGSTKMVAEKAVMESGLDWTIVRTVLVYGQTIEGTRSNIINWVKQNLEEGNSIKVVTDQWRTPTFVDDLVKGILLIIEKKARGIFHISGSDGLSPYDMAIKTARYFKLSEQLIEKVDSSNFRQPGQRPLKTGFKIDKAKKELGYEPLSFDESLKKMFG
jgi:dTDP-4-dehydrorhamnose reductase